MGIIEDYYNYSLEELRRFFESAKAGSSGGILGQNIDENFEKLKKLEMKNLQDLLTALKTRKKIETFSTRSGLTMDYLVLFRRRLNKYFPQPVKLERLVDAEKSENLKKLKHFEIADTFDMLEAGRTKRERENLAKKTAILESHILELVKLSDLCRIYGVKDTRARLYHDAGVDTLEKMAKLDPVKLIEVASGFIKRTEFKGIAPLPKEAAFTVAEAKKLPRIVEY